MADSSRQKMTSKAPNAVPLSEFITGRIPPQSLESERALLGALLLKPDAIHDVSDLIRADSFYAEKHRLIFGAMRELADRGEPIDQLSLSQRLLDQGLLERSGGRSYLAELVAAAPAPGNYAHYAELVSRKSLMRSLIEAAYGITESAYDEARETMERFRCTQIHRHQRQDSRSVGAP
jgi:replicative DNA helicase